MLPRRKWWWPKTVGCSKYIIIVVVVVCSYQFDVNANRSVNRSNIILWVQFFTISQLNFWFEHIAPKIIPFQSIFFKNKINWTYLYCAIFVDYHPFSMFQPTKSSHPIEASLIPIHERHPDNEKQTFIFKRGEKIDSIEIRKRKKKKKWFFTFCLLMASVIASISLTSTW